MLWPFNKYPGTDYETYNWEWIISTVKRLQTTVDHWVNDIKDYVLEILSDHPEWIQNWMLDDNSVTYDKIAADAVDASKITDLFERDLVDKYGTADFTSARGDSWWFLDCAMTWVNNADKLYYGNGMTPNMVQRYQDTWRRITEKDPAEHIAGRDPIDCQSFVSMVLAGIGYEESVFGNATNEQKYNSYNIPWTANKFMDYKGVNQAGYYTPPTFEEGQYDRLVTWQMAEWFKDRGLLQEYHSPEQLHAGDILYVAHENEVIHCSIYCGRMYDKAMVLECSDVDPNRPVGFFEHTLNPGASYPIKYFVSLPTIADTRHENIIMTKMYNQTNGNARICRLTRDIKQNALLKVYATVVLPAGTTDAWFGVVLNGYQFNRIQVNQSRQDYEILVPVEKLRYNVPDTSEITWRLTSDGTTTIPGTTIIRRVEVLYAPDTDTINIIHVSSKSADTTNSRNEVAAELYTLSNTVLNNRNVIDVQISLGDSDYEYGFAKLYRYTSSMYSAIVYTYQDVYKIVYANNTPTFTRIEYEDVPLYI